MSDDGRNRRGEDSSGDRSAEDFDMFAGRSGDQPESAEDGSPRRRHRQRPAADSAADTSTDNDSDAEAGDGQSTEKGSAKTGGATADTPPRPRRGKAKRGTALPALRPAEPSTPALRAERVEAIRRDLVRRRRRKGLGVLARLLAFVIVPTIVVAWFLWTRASHLYQTEAVFVVQTAEPGGISGGGGGGLFAAFSGGVTDAVSVQNFILSRDVLRRLDDDLGLLDHYRDPNLDWFHRLAPDASFEAAHAHFQRFTEVSFDPTEGVLTLTVVASDPDYARALATAIIGYSEEMVDSLSDPIRENALRDADANLEAAEERLRLAQLEAADLRKELETFSVEGQFSSEMNIITQLEIELAALSARLTNLRRVTGDDDPRVQRLMTQVETLEEQISVRRGGVTGGSGRNGSLSDINAQLERANFEVTAAMALFTSAIEAREFARTEAQRQHRYLSVVVAPSLPDASNYPKKAETTALAFLIFLGIYIMLSLTISLIREQASI